jgi:hypothetical protein
MNHNVKRLFDIEIDEVSVVDRPANQHGLIAFAKNDSSDELETGVPEDLFDETGENIPVEVLEHGDIVYDAEGNEFVYVEDDEDDDDVEKGWQEEAAKFGIKAKETFGQGVRAAKRGQSQLYNAGKRAEKLGATQEGFAGQARQTAGRSAQWIARNPGKSAAITGGTLGAANYAFGKAEMSDQMSLGDSVLEELSKAVTERDREYIIAKAMDEVEIAKAQAAEAFEYAAALEDARIEDAFISKAAEYNLPVSPEVFGPILKSIAETLSDEELELLDELFSSIGDSLYNEIGYVGDTSNSSVLDAVEGLASEFVGKSDVSYEQAYAAMFEANPSAYDAYLSEGR